MGNFFVTGFYGMIILITLCFILTLSCKIIELIWLCLYKIISPLLSPIRHRKPYPIKICCCSHMREKLKKYKKTHTSKIKPIIYDDLHIIVINPYEKYQIATVSKIINN
jgi:hypothetical protein